MVLVLSHENHFSAFFSVFKVFDQFLVFVLFGRIARLFAKLECLKRFWTILVEVFVAKHFSFAFSLPKPFLSIDQ